MNSSEAGFWIALWGAVVATVLAVLRVREFFADRGHLKFRSSVQHTLTPAPPGAAPTHQLASGPRVVFTVTNVGRRKLRVMGFGIRMGWSWKRRRKRDRKWRPFLTQHFPRDLGEGETMEFDDPVYQRLLTGPHITTAFVYDSLGGCWELPRRSFRNARDPTSLTLPPEVLQRRPRTAP